MPKCKIGKCMIEDCPNTKIYARGICPTHYRMINVLVKEKKRTWQEFVNVGMAAIPQRDYGQRKRFEEMMKKKKLK